MQPAADMRAVVDKLRKTYANTPLLATGGDRRMSAESINTASMSRAKGQQRKLPRDVGTLPLRELARVGK